MIFFFTLHRRRSGQESVTRTSFMRESESGVVLEVEQKAVGQTFKVERDKRQDRKKQGGVQAFKTDTSKQKCQLALP